MNEETIVAFLAGRTSADRLEVEATAAVERISASEEIVHVRATPTRFIVGREMLLRLCDAALESRISPHALRIIAFTIISSPAIEWRDALVGEVLHDWSAPEVNWPLTEPNVKQFRRWMTHEDSYPKTEKPEESQQRVSVLERASPHVPRRNWAAMTSALAFVCSWPLPAAMALAFAGQFESFAERQGPTMLWLIVLWVGGWSFLGALTGGMALILSLRGYSGRALAISALVLNLLFVGFQLRNIGVF